MKFDPALLTNWPALAEFVPTTYKDTYPLISPLNCNLSGKSVFITGASRGIGRSTAISFAQAGATYIAIGARSDLSSTEAAVLSAAEKAGRPKPTILSIRGDLATESGAAEAASRIQESFPGKRLDVLVNNAAIGSDTGRIDESRPDDYWQQFQVNVNGVYIVTRAMMPLMRRTDQTGGGEEGKGGIVLNVTSGGAHMLFSGLSSYHTSKMTVTRMTEYWSSEYGSARDEREPVFVSLHPGSVPTDLTKGVIEELKPMIDMKAELAADTMVWLAKERRAWLTGRFVSVTWDVSELEGRKEDIVERDLLKFRMTV